jgi:hypothetical protein
MEKPMCSEKTEKNRLRRATFLPVVSQKRGSSGRQSSIHLPRPVGGAAVGAAAVFSGVLVDSGWVGAAMPTTVARAGFTGVAPRGNPCSVSLTAADPLW